MGAKYSGRLFHPFVITISSAGDLGPGLIGFAQSGRIPKLAKNHSGGIFSCV